MIPLVFAVNVAAATLAPAKGGEQSLPPLRRSRYALKIFVVEPDRAAAPGRFSDFDGSTVDGLRVGIWSSSVGTDDTLLALADVTDFTYTSDATGNYFTGTLNTNTAQWAEFLGADSSATAYCSFALVKGLDVLPILDHRGKENVTLYPATDPGSGAAIDLTKTVPIIPANTKIGPFASGLYCLITEISPGNFQLSATP